MQYRSVLALFNSDGKIMFQMAVSTSRRFINKEIAGMMLAISTVHAKTLNMAFTNVRLSKI